MFSEINYYLEVQTWMTVHPSKWLIGILGWMILGLTYMTLSLLIFLQVELNVCGNAIYQFLLNILPGYVKVSEVTQSCPTLCDPMDCSLPGFSVHGILQARMLEWVTISFSRGSSWSRDWTQVSRIGGRCFNLWATREAPVYWRTSEIEIKNCASMYLYCTDS